MNRLPISTPTLKQLFGEFRKTGYFGSPNRPATFDQGLGDWSLCSLCNGRTGDMYGEGFFQWTLQCAKYAATGAESVYVPFAIAPLHVIKQIAVMTLALALPQSLGTKHHRRLRGLVYNKYDFGLAPGFRFYVYLCAADYARIAHFYGAILTGMGSVLIDAEIARFPAGYVIVGDDESSNAAAQHYGLTEITHFLRYDYREIRVVHLRLPILKPVTASALTFEGRTPLPNWP